MASWEDLLPTPEGYATPEQLASTRAYANALLKKSTETRPIYNKAWGGLNMMAQALGGTIGNQIANKQERARKMFNAGEGIPDTGEGGAIAPTGANFMKGAPSPGNVVPGKTSSGLSFQANKDAMPSMQGFLDDLIASGAPVTSVGSYNNRNIAGTNVLSQHAHGNALDINQSGRNQVSPEFKAWAAANPDKLTEIEKKYNMVSGAGFKSGGPDFGHWEWGGPGKAMPFNGEPSNLPQAGGVDPMVSALAGPGATFPTPKAVPTEAGGNGWQIPSAVINQRPRLTRQQLQHVLASEDIPEERKQATLQMYLQQNQPVQMETTGGTVLVGRNGEQHFIPKLIEKTLKSSSGSEAPGFFTMEPGKGIKAVPMEGGLEAPAGKGPAPADVPNLQYATTGQPGKGMLDANGLPPEILTGQSAPPAASIPNMPDFDGEKPLPLPPNPEPDTTHGIDRTLKGNGMLNFAPPDGGDVTAPPLPRAGTAGKTAQAGGVGGMLDALDRRGLNYEAQKRAIDKEADSYQKKYDTVTTAGQRAQASRPMLEMARKLIDDPRFVSGIGADARVDWQRLKAFAGIDPKGATANESFAKIISGQILEDMKVTLQGLGQVRVAEIDLLSKAAANQYLNPSANRLILDLMMKAHDKAATVGRIASGYQAGARWDKDGKVIRDTKGGTLVHEGAPKLGELDGVINKYLDKNPILTKDEQSELQKLIASDKGYGAPEEPEKKGKYAKERPQPQPRPAERQAPPAPRPAGAPPAGYE